MENTILFDELVKNLTGANNAPLAKQEPDFKYEEIDLKEFVGAPLSGDRDNLAPHPKPSIVIISASGAVGKSTLAKKISFLCKLPLWDLSKYGPVGQGSFMGRLTTAYGTSQVGAIIAAIGSGKFSVVIDALDEARIKINDSAFRAFITDVGSSSSKNPDRPIILLGRTQIAETTWLILSDLGVEVNLYTIEPFTEEQSHQYVELKVRGLKKDTANSVDAHKASFREALNKILGALKRALESERGSISASEIRAFLGYAPVLDAVSTFLASEGNFKALVEDIGDSAAGKFSHTAMLRKIVESIVNREHTEKLQKSIRPTMDSLAKRLKWNQWEVLYNIDEQIMRLLWHILGKSKTFSIAIPSDLQSKYEEQISVWFSEHPFLKDGRYIANSVFESYLFARALVEGVGDCTIDVQNLLNSADYKPSRLLADFYFLILAEKHGDLVPPEHVGILYNSFLSAETEQVRVSLSVDGPILSDANTDVKFYDIDCEFQFINVKDSQIITSIPFTSVLKKETEISFNKYLRDLHLSLPCTVALGEAGKELEIGPAVHIECYSLNIKANQLIVGGNSIWKSAVPGDDAVVLEAQNCRSAIAGKPIAHTDFQVSWPGAEAYPWNEYNVSPNSQDIPPESMRHNVYRRLRRIALAFRSHSRGQLARFQEKIEHQRTLQGEIGERLLKKLRESKVLELHDHFYYWNSENADKTLGVSWQQIKNWKTSPKLLSYIDSLAK